MSTAMLYSPWYRFFIKMQSKCSGRTNQLHKLCSVGSSAVLHWQWPLRVPCIHLDLLCNSFVNQGRLQLIRAYRSGWMHQSATCRLILIRWWFAMSHLPTSLLGWVNQHQQALIIYGPAVMLPNCNIYWIVKLMRQQQEGQPDGGWCNGSHKSRPYDHWFCGDTVLKILEIVTAQIAIFIALHNFELHYKIGSQWK